MADIELVVKIPEELISEIDHNNYQSVISWFNTTLYCAIKDGTPLPKGHGRLVDGSKLENLRFSERSNVWLMDKILKAKTIVEADQESDAE